MFNKPNIFGRNEPITRRDANPVPASGAKPAVPTAESSATSSASRPVSTVRSTPEAPVVAKTTAAVTTPPPALAEAVIPKESEMPTSNDNIMGARLLVGPDVKLRGAEILDCDTLVVEGRVEATMDSRVIRIAENGSFAGKVSIDIAEIHGTFEGELTARSQLIIHSTGRVSGTIRYGKLVADEGCELCGDINTLSASTAQKSKPVVEPFLALSAAAG